MNRHLPTGRALTLLVIVFAFILWAVGMFGALLTEPSATPEPTPTLPVRVIAESPVPATPTRAPLVEQTPTTREPIRTPLPTATSTPVPTATVEPTRTPNAERSPVQRG